MYTSTTPFIEGTPIKQHLGLISAEVIVGANFVKDFFAGLTDFFWGRSGAYESALQTAKKEALAELIQRAEKMGANAVVGIDMQFEAVGKGSMFLVNINGTAVRV